MSITAGCWSVLRQIKFALRSRNRKQREIPKKLLRDSIGTSILIGMTTKREIEVLEKFDLAVNFEKGRMITILCSVNEVTRREEFDVDVPVKVPYNSGYHNHRWTLDEAKFKELEEAALSYCVAEAEYSEALYKRLNHYLKLINSSLYFEDVVSVWTEALEVKDKIIGTASTALITLSEETVEFIKKDQESRKSA